MSIGGYSCARSDFGMYNADMQKGERRVIRWKCFVSISLMLSIHIARAGTEALLSGVELGADRSTISSRAWNLETRKGALAKPAKSSLRTEDVPLLDADTNEVMTARLRYSDSNRLEAIGVSVVGPSAHAQLRRWESALTSAYGNAQVLSEGASGYCHDKKTEVLFGGVSEEAFLAVLPVTGFRCAEAPASRSFDPVFFHVVQGSDAQAQFVQVRFKVGNRAGETDVNVPQTESVTMWVGGRWIRLDLVLKDGGTAPINGKFAIKSSAANCSGPLTQKGLGSKGEIVLRRSVSVGKCQDNCELLIDGNQMVVQEVCEGKLTHRSPIPQLPERDNLKIYLEQEAKRLAELRETERKIAAEQQEQARKAAIAAMQLPPHGNAGTLVTRTSKQLKVSLRDVDDLGIVVAMLPNGQIEQLATAEWTADAVGSTEEEIGSRLALGENRIVFFLHNKRLMGNQSKWNYRFELKDEGGTRWSHSGGGVAGSVGIRFWRAFTVVKSSDGRLLVQDADAHVISELEPDMRKVNDDIIRTRGEETTVMASALRFFWRAMEPQEEVIVVRRRGLW